MKGQAMKGQAMQRRDDMTARGAFTITEMLVVTAIISLLVGILMPAVSSARVTARMNREKAAARQLMVAYNNYTVFNKDKYMPGYLIDDGIRVVDQQGRSVADLSVPPAAARYPWRLAPYLDFTMEGLYVNGQRQQLEEMRQIDEWHYFYFSSLAPSLGLNATWIGGDQDEQGFSVLARRLFGQFYARTPTEVVHPSRLLVFTSARGLDPLNLIDNLGVTEGYFRVRSPRLNTIEGDRWPAEYGAVTDPADFGFVSMRGGRGAVTAFVDGHVETLGERALRDMRHWANRAETPDYALAPQDP